MRAPLENNSQRTPPGRRPGWLGWVLLGTALLILAAFLFPAANISNPAPRRAVARTDTAQLAAALKQYNSEYATLPTGDNARILAVLCGDNPRKIVFFECRPA